MGAVRAVGEKLLVVFYASEFAIPPEISDRLARGALFPMTRLIREPAVYGIVVRVVCFVPVAVFRPQTGNEETGGGGGAHLKS